MKPPVRNLVAAILLLSLASCVGLEYPSYWDFEDNLLVNLITLPIEILITPIIFVIKLLPVL